MGPSLGLDSIRKGITASVAGALLVFLAVVLYYRRAGWNAVLLTHCEPLQGAARGLPSVDFVS